MFGPVAKDRTELSAGVKAEIEKAIEYGVPCYVYQPPDWDPNNHFMRFLGPTGTLGRNNIQTWVNRCSSIEEMIDRVCQEVRRN